MFHVHLYKHVYMHIVMHMHTCIKQAVLYEPWEIQLLHQSPVLLRPRGLLQPLQSLVPVAKHLGTFTGHLADL